MVIYILLKGFALKIFHYYVGGVVLLEVVDNIDNAVFLAELGYVLCLVKEALHALLEKFLLAARDLNLSQANAVSRARGIKLLYRHALVKRCVHSYIGYAEAALAESVADKVLARKHCAGSKMIRLVSAGLAVVIAAV